MTETEKKRPPIALASIVTASGGVLFPFTGALGVSLGGDKVRAKFGNTFVNFASLDDLIEMKKIAGRSQDLENLKYLRRLKKSKVYKS